MYGLKIGVPTKNNWSRFPTGCSLCKVSGHVTPLLPFTSRTATSTDFSACAGQTPGSRRIAVPTIKHRPQCYSTSSTPGVGRCRISDTAFAAPKSLQTQPDGDSNPHLPVSSPTRYQLSHHDLSAKWPKSFCFLHFKNHFGNR